MCTSKINGFTNFTNHLISYRFSIIDTAWVFSISSCSPSDITMVSLNLSRYLQMHKTGDANEYKEQEMSWYNLFVSFCKLGLDQDDATNINNFIRPTKKW